jgi:hypothetical protein
MDTSGKTDLAELIEDEPMIKPTVDWLRAHRCDPATIVAESLHALRQRNTFLPRWQRVLYTSQAVLGNFFVIWAKKHRGKVVQPLNDKDELVPKEEVKAFERAVAVLATERVFEKVVKRLVRRHKSDKVSLEIGTADAYTSHALSDAKGLADVFLKNFDLNRRNPSRSAPPYLMTISVSRYLHREMRESRDDYPLIRYLNGKNKLAERSRLAAKLVVMPALLTFEETQILRSKYGMEGGFALRRRVRDVAQALGYPKAAVLSRKLYQIREWAESAPPNKQSAPPPPIAWGQLVEVDDE